MRATLKLLVGLLVCGMSVSAFGQSCTAGATYPATPVLMPNVDLCASTDQLTKTCANGTSLAAGPDAIYSVTVGTQQDLAFHVVGTGFNPYIALMSGAACNSLDTCGPFENTGSAGTTISLPNVRTLPAGQYWLVISDATANITCPGATFTLSSTGFIPVKLQSFEID